MTAVYHRRFWPDDVDGTVAYVAPLSYGHDDPRYVDFLESVGDAACRSRLVALQREALRRRDQLLSVFDVASWVATEGERLLFVYGENDPWSAGAFELGDATDFYVLTVPSGTHGSLIED